MLQITKETLKKTILIWGISLILVYALISIFIIKNDLSKNKSVQDFSELAAKTEASLQQIASLKDTDLESVQIGSYNVDNGIENPITTLTSTVDYKPKPHNKGGKSSYSSSLSEPQSPTSQEVSTEQTSLASSNNDKIDPQLKELIEKSPEKTVSVILSISDFQNVDEIVKLLELNDAKSIEKLDIGDFVIVTIPAKKLNEIVKEADISAISSDKEVAAVLDSSIDQINAPIAWNLGFTGKGVKIAILDSGINKDHPMLEGKVINEISFAGENPDDLLSHGTPIAGIIAGSEVQGYKGIAPDSKLINIKVLNDEGKGSNINVIKGINYALEQGAKILVMAFSGAYNDPDSPINKAIKEAVDKGVLVVAASGNCGTDKASSRCGNFSGVGVPGNSPEAITVGSVDKYNKVALFSGGGSIENAGIKPDIVAPGVDVTAPIGLNDFMSFSGTSISAPFVAGAVALLLESNPNFSPSQIKQIIEENALDLGDSGKDIRYGSGIIDFERMFSDKPKLINGITVIPEYVFAQNEKVYIVVKADSAKEIVGTIKLPDSQERNLIFEQAEGLWKTEFSETSLNGDYPIEITAKADGISDFATAGIEVLDSQDYEADPMPIILNIETNEIIPAEKSDVEAAGIENNVCGGAISGLDPGREGINRIGAPGDVDYWKGSASTGRTLDFRIDAPSGKNYLLDVYGKCSLGLFPDEHKGSCSSGQSCQISVLGGTYYVRIKGKSLFTDWSTTNYKVSVKIPASPSCTPKASFSCFDNDIYYFDSCNNKGDKKDECEGTKLISQGTNYCSSDKTKILRNDILELKGGCITGGKSCISSNQTTVTTVQTCGSTQICQNAQCVDKTVPKIIDAFWSKTSAVDGEVVTMTASTIGLDGKLAKFEIYEDDLFNDDFVTSRTTTVSNGRASVTWSAQFQDDSPNNPPEFYFNVVISGVNPKKSGLITVTKPTVCFVETDCGADSFSGNRFCIGNDVYQNFVNYTCAIPGTDSCAAPTFPHFIETCQFGCDNGECLNQTKEPADLAISSEDITII